MTRRKTRISLNRLDDRITPSGSDGTIPAFVPYPYPNYWQETKFIPTTTTPAADGGTWVVGNTQAAGQPYWYGPWNNYWGVVKLTATGLIDPAFNGGKVKDINSGILDWFRILEIHSGPDGKLYALGRNISRDPIPVYEDYRGVTPNYDTNAPMPLNPAAITVPTTTAANILQNDSPIPAGLSSVVANPQEGFAMIRFNSDGSLDTSFGSDGIKLFDLSASINSYWYGQSDAKFAEDSQGRTIVAGIRNQEYGTGPTGTIDVVRFTTAGDLDTSFSGDGKAEVAVALTNRSNVTFNGQLLGLELDATGNVFLGGGISEYGVYTGDNNSSTDPHYGLFVAKLKGDGSTDTAFDGDGLSTIDFQTTPVFPQNRSGNVSDFTVSSLGEPLFVGTSYFVILPPGSGAVTTNGYVLRMTPAGALDTSFDGDGVLYPSFSNSLFVSAGQKIVALPNGGFAIGVQEVPDGFASTVSNYAVAKYLDDGTLDPAFQVVRQSPANYGYVTDLSSQPDGRLIAVTGYPQELIAIDSNGVRSVKWTVSYYRQLPWTPPAGYQPFWFQPVFRTASGDFNGDGVTDYAFATGAGTETAIRIVDGATGNDLISMYTPYESQFHGGMFIDIGDFNGDGKDEIVISPDDGGSARIQIFSYEANGLAVRANFFAIQDPNFRGGGSIAISDIDGDGTPDLLVGAAKGGSQRIATFNGKNLLGAATLPPVLFGDYFAPLSGVDPTIYRNGVTLERRDVNQDGKDDVIIQPLLNGSAGQDDGIVLFHGSYSSTGFISTLKYQKWIGTAPEAKHTDGIDAVFVLFSDAVVPPPVN